MRARGKGEMWGNGTRPIVPELIAGWASPPRGRDRIGHSSSSSDLQPNPAQDGHFLRGPIYHKFCIHIPKQILRKLRLHGRPRVLKVRPSFKLFIYGLLTRVPSPEARSARGNLPLLHITATVLRHCLLLRLTLLRSRNVRCTSGEASTTLTEIVPTQRSVQRRAHAPYAAN